MRKSGIFRSIINAIMDPEREFNERMYLALTIVSEIAVFIALLGDIITKDSPIEIAVIVGVLIFVPALMIICLRKEKIKLATRITVIGLVFIIIPALYFFGGGIEGGGVLWIIFVFTYAGLVMTGTWRKVIFVLIVAVSLGCYVIEYFMPELVYGHTRRAFFIDSYIGIILVGFVCFAMTWLQNYLFMGENERARAAAKKAEELTRAQNRFFSSMSHEIRTPINSILGLNELILRDQDATDEIVKDASGIQGSGKMLLALINDILDFSKMEAGSMDIVPVNYKVGDMLSEIVNMVWIRAHDKGLKLNVSIDPEVPSILYGDEVRIKQIIVNLLNNAVKYTSEGSVELHVESEKKDETTVELSIFVTDTGMGIKKEALPYLFDAFKRVDEEKNRHIEGTGLGLSIVKQLIELMGGTVTVNSVYGAGSTFTVQILQGIADETQIGDLNIHNQSFVNRKSYECSFRAPEAKILIVDDNEMNLEVESKLLAETEMTIHKATSGKEALELCLKEHYDVIFMDHLMPEMDGIECFEKIRNQVGGLSRATPVVVLTANAGSENRDIYNRAGFEGYLIKPISGEALENALMRYISSEKLIVNNNKMTSAREDISTSAGYSGKMPILVTSTSMCDLPNYMTNKFIPILPFLVNTEEGIFKDGDQMGADELIRYIRSGKRAESAPPDETVYRDFFSQQLKHAHHVIHIAITSSMSTDYKTATEAARSFDNVTVIDSECLSSATGILVLIAIKLAQMNVSVEELVKELETVKKRLMCSFIIDNTEYMARRGLISSRVDKLARNLNMHPCLEIKNNRSRIGGVWLGKTKRAYKKYIAKAFPADVAPDPEIVFITYADVPMDTLLWIREEISKVAFFEHVIFQQASAAITSNCGPGTFGILYFIKSNKSYNLSTYIVDKELIDDGDDDQVTADNEIIRDTEASKEESIKTEVSADGAGMPEYENEPVWYKSIECIDGDAAIKNSGSEDAFKAALEIFYDSIERKAEELETYYRDEDFKNYTIKVHALKSSCKLIGALGTSEKAQRLEDAGKAENIEYIRENHSVFIEEYKGYKSALSKVFEKDEAESAAKDDRPVADDFLMESLYEGLHDAAESMDVDAMEEVLKEIEGYAIPKKESEKFNKIAEKVSQLDYEGVLSILDED
ncbi:DegV family protein [Butyrivibrio sp. VCD2006]|uniref:DegV family protein n=1 Tax=Butyrivibrio sp. VCD2006 TaxID=1280664 RepID=UPI000426899B|nr:DegV family protein [Butyrivibrio sp. VCD2006]